VQLPKLLRIIGHIFAFDREYFSNDLFGVKPETQDYGSDWKLKHHSIKQCEKYFNTVSHLGIDHGCDGWMDGQTELRMTFSISNSTHIVRCKLKTSKLNRVVKSD